MLNAAHALLGFRRLGPLRRLRVLRCSRFLGFRSDNRTLRERDREFGWGSEKELRGLIRTSPSTGSSSAFFLVDFLAPAVVEDLVWRVELRVARVDVVTGSVSSPPRFLLDDAQHGVYSNR